MLDEYLHGEQAIKAEEEKKKKWQEMRRSSAVVQMFKQEALKREDMTMVKSLEDPIFVGIMKSLDIFERIRGE